MIAPVSLETRRVAMFVLNDMRLDSRVRREAGTLGAAGYQVTVYAVMSDATRHLPRERADGYEIVRLPMLMRPATEATARPGARSHPRLGRAAFATAFAATRPMFGGTLHFVANWQLRWNSWARRVAETVAPADVWHAHDFNTLGLANSLARRFGGALVYDSHEIFTDAGATSALPGAVRAAIRGRERAWTRAASAVLTVNDSIADVLRGRLGIDVAVLRNCAVPPSVGLSPLRAAIGVDGRARVVMYHGSVTVGRGIAPLIESFADHRMDGAHLVVMGYGPLRPAMQELAERSPARDRIHLLPPVPPGDVTRWVAGADVAAMPIEPTTLNHRLSSPNKLFEAIAAGVPVVGPDFVEFRRIVLDSRHGPLGRLHQDHSPASIAGELSGILALTEAERLALRARCRAASDGQWNWERESGRLLDRYATLSSVGARMAHPVVERRAHVAVADE